MVNITRILCPVDLSEFSRDALRHALALAESHEARITVCHVYSAPQPPFPVLGMPDNAPIELPRPDEIAEHVRRFCASSKAAAWSRPCMSKSFQFSSMHCDNSLETRSASPARRLACKAVWIQ